MSKIAEDKKFITTTELKIWGIPITKSTSLKRLEYCRG